MKTVRWGIIGAGNIAASFAKALNGIQSNDIELVAVASRDEERSKAFAHKWNSKRYYSAESATKAGFESAYKQLFADSEIDVVYIAIPHRFHAEIAIQALEAGKHVLCEKPATVNAQELQEVLACAKKQNKFFMEALWTKFNPSVQKVLQWIQDGKIGDVLHIKADFCFATPMYGENVLGITPTQYDKTSRLLNPSLAGGAFLDVGVYTAFIAMMVAGSAPNILKQKTNSVLQNSSEPCRLPDAIHAVARKNKDGIDLWNGVTMQFNTCSDSSITAQLSSAIDFGGEKGSQDAWIFGTKGKIKIPLFWMAQSIELYATEYNTDTLVEKIEMPFKVNGYEYEILHVVDCINKISKSSISLTTKESLIESPIHTFDDMVNISKVLDECRRQTGILYPFENIQNNKMKDNSAEIAQKTGDEAVSQKSTGGEIIMYTDGACSGNPGPGGWGCVIIASGREIPLSGGEKLTTNNRMELMAAIQGFERIQSVPEWRVRPIKVFIDSQYVKNGITKWIDNWKINGWNTAAKKPVKNRDLWIQLDRLNGELDVNWHWVKGHAGNKYNEQCDQLAVKAGNKAR
ncbi:MAG: ribonuclease HI [Treponema sp. CETP13]|nr:MAG: ribonuclease HI [Treponema sp. CETP13]